MNVVNDVRAPGGVTSASSLFSCGSFWVAGLSEVGSCCAGTGGGLDDVVLARVRVLMLGPV